MKKIFILAFSFAALPAIATCSITGGACGNIRNPALPLENKYVQPHIQNVIKPDYKQQTAPYSNPYTNKIPSTPTGGAASEKSYDSNCQFGICLPTN